MSVPLINTQLGNITQVCMVEPFSSINRVSQVKAVQVLCHRTEVLSKLILMLLEILLCSLPLVHHLQSLATFLLREQLTHRFFYLILGLSVGVHRYSCCFQQVLDVGVTVTLQVPHVCNVFCVGRLQ